ncbi:MAG: DUF1501 domain-containing protein, partial [Limisphaerales bacterium]
MTRRRWLQGGGALAGAMLWPQLLRAKETQKASSAPARACIVIYLQGGLSHYESFDPKPDAPSAYRSTFGDIPTTLPGIHFAEHLPLLAVCVSFARSNCGHNIAPASAPPPCS